jgi:hypothetical protein
MTCTLHVAWDGRLAGYDFGPGTLVGTNTQTGPQSVAGRPFGPRRARRQRRS